MRRPALAATAVALLGILVAPTATAQASDPGLAIDPVVVTGAGLAAAAAAFAAGLVPLVGTAPSARRMHALLGVSAGLLLTVALAEMVPHALSETPHAVWWIAGVFGALLLAEWTLGGHGHDHHRGPRHVDGTDDRSGPGTSLAWVALLAMSVHRLAGGLAMPAAFGLDTGVGVAVLAALLAHQIPDGLATASLLAGGGWSRSRIVPALALVALWVPLGAFAGLALAGSSVLRPVLLAISAATFLYIAVVELVPELLASDHRVPVLTGFVLGAILAWVLVVELTKLV